MNNVVALKPWVNDMDPSVAQTLEPAVTHADAAIAIRALCKSYDGPMVVNHVEFTVGQGEFVTLLGPSGSGKTSTLMMIAGFEQPTSGDILLHGRSIVDVPARYRDLGIVFQSYALFPHMSVLENVAFPLRMRKVPKAERRRRAAEMLDRVGLGTYKDRLPRQLSGGQQQRVALARALVFDPRALLLDEPLGALDKRLRDQLQLEIKAIQKKVGVSIVFVTHDQNEAMMMSDKIVVMNRGRVEQIGTPNEVYNHPETSFVATFLGETNLIPCSVESRSGSQAVISTALCGHRGGATISTKLPESSSYGISIRPERLRLINDPSEVDGYIDGQVLSRVFLGASHRVVVATGSQNIVLSIPDTARMPRLDPGDRVRCGWSICDAQLLSMDSEVVQKAA